MKGRLTGSPELEKAAAYLAAQFKALGIAPADGKSYYQRFQVTTRAKLGKANALAYSLNGDKRIPSALGRDFQPYNFSGTGKGSGPVVFAGYGITAPEYDYDDYAGLDVKGKTVLVLRHEPQEFDEKSRFAGRLYTTHALMQNKAVNARFHGARAVLFVSDASNHPADADPLEKFSQHVAPNSPDVPFVQIRAELADQWLSAAGQNLKQWIESVDKDLKPRSFELPKLSVDLEAQVERQQRQVPNVCAYLRGTSDEYIILGAHFDHLGLGEQSSMAPSQAGKAVHPGADDNASGAAGLLELAAYFAGQPKPRRGLLFLAFAGEELGLLGSNYYVNHPLLPLDHAAAMINMDMIGRIKDRRVFVGGVGTGDTLAGLLDQAKAASSLQTGPQRAGRLRLERPFLVHAETGARAVLLLRPAHGLPQAQRHARQDPEPRGRRSARARLRRHPAPGRGARAAEVHQDLCAPAHRHCRRVGRLRRLVRQRPGHVREQGRLQALRRAAPLARRRRRTQGRRRHL